MVFVETSFPRGGTLKPSDEAALAASAAASTSTDVEFGAATFKRKKEKLNKKQRDEKHIRDTEERSATKAEAISAELLSLRTISEGMLVMGCISKIDATYVQIALPGRLTGRVLVTAMAPAYVDVVNRYVNDVANVQGYKTLEELYTIGQIVCCKVMAIRAGPDQPRALIELSMNPADLQADFQHKKVAVGALLCAAISDIEDHGYVLNAGIANLRAFMPLADAGAEPNWGIGELLFVRVQQAKSAAAASTVVCKAVEAVAERTPPATAKEATNLAHILPTSVVKFKVSKILRDGLQGTVLNEAFTAYVNEHQLEKALATPEQYAVDAELEARVLYVMPLTKLVYLSLNLTEQIAATDSELRVGTIIAAARVTRIGTGGLIVRLNKQHKGLVSFRSLRSGGGYSANFDSDELMAKYHKNSVHRVRITGYDPMDSLYVCTTNAKLLAEKYFTIDDVEVTDFVDATIVHRLADGGYFAKVGQVKAYLEKAQISASTPAQKLQDGARLRCRVLRKHARDSKLFLTNRKEFMSEDALLLRSTDKAVVGLDYYGMVVKIFADGYLVSFCQYVKGMLYKRNLSEEDAAAADYYRVGQILKFRVQFVRNDGFITLGLGDFVCQTGTTMMGKVATVDENGLNIALPTAKLNGFVPSMLLTDFTQLRPLMHQTYAANERLEAICVAHNVYSVRDVQRCRVQPVRKWADIRVGDILPAYVKDVKGDVVELMCLIEQYAKTVRLHVKMLLEDWQRETRIDLVPEQLLYVRVLGKNDMLKSLTVSAKLSHVWRGDLGETARQWRQYFADLQRVQRYCEKIGNALATVKVGVVVQAKVLAVEEERATLRLPGNVTGVIAFSGGAAAERRVEAGASVKVLVVWVDYVANVVYCSANPVYVRRATEAASGAAAEAPAKKRLQHARGLKADVLLVHDNVAVLYPRKCCAKFIYVPTRLHHNDLQPVVMAGVRAGDLVNVTAIDSDDEFTLGMFEGIRALFDKFLVRREASRQTKKLAALLREPKEAEENQKGKKDKKGAAAVEVKDEVKEEEESTVATELVYSGDVVKTEDGEEEDDDVGGDEETLADHDLFFEDTLGSTAGPAQTPVAAKNSGKRKAQAAQVSAQKQIKLEQLDGATGRLAADSESDEEFEAKKVTLTAAKKKTTVAATKRKFEKRTKAPVAPPKLPGAGGFWSTSLADAHKLRQSAAAEESSSSEEDADAGESSRSAVKKPKISTADRFRLARTEEARVRSIEESYADVNAPATTVDHHERLVMATPNSSLAWINYMVFHMQCNEIHRARVVARKAFKKISIREGEELLNVWVALLNLELRYGDKEAFDAVLAEAVQLNEPFKVYSKALQMLVSVAKVEELTDMVLTFTKKFRANPDCWPQAAAAFFEVGLVEKAQPLLNRALASLPERDHVSTIIKFAALNNKHNNKDRAHALMEQILTAYPKRVDCWSQYVDMLVKDKEITIARQILERAVSQKIPMKKMRTLFKKYLDFEERFGDEEAILKLKAMAATYVEKELKA